MSTEELNKILASHNAWLDGVSGERAYLRGADLRDVGLRGANLRGVDLRDADLRNADMRGADMRGADLRDANLRHADLRDADLRDADLRDADLDYSAWPLWCGSLTAKIDKRIAAQLMYHALRAMQSCADDPEVAAVLASDACLRLADQFHRVDLCGQVEPTNNSQEGGAK